MCGIINRKATGKEGQGKSKVIGRLAPASALEGGLYCGKERENEQETEAKITTREPLLVKRRS